MFFKLSCIVGLVISILDGSERSLFFAGLGLLLIFSEKVTRLLLWFVVVGIVPLLAITGHADKISQLALAWPYALVYLIYLLILKSIAPDDPFYRRFDALGWLALAAQGWLISGWIIYDVITLEFQDPKPPVLYLIATIPAALSASYYVVRPPRRSPARSTRSRIAHRAAPRPHPPSQPTES